MEQCGHRRRGRDHRPWFAPAKGRKSIELQLEPGALYVAEQIRDLAGKQIVDVANEPQRQVIIIGIDPASAWQPAAQHRQRLADVGWYFQCGEKSRHDRRSSTSRRGTALWDLHNDVEIRAPRATLHFITATATLPGQPGPRPWAHCGQR